MTVEELIKQLSELDPKLKVLSAGDDEGNNFRYIGSVNSYKVLKTKYGFDIMNDEDYASMNEEDKNLYHDAVIIW